MADLHRTASTHGWSVVRYEIRAITHLPGERNLLVDVAYWHDDGALPTATPDFVEHHLVINVPTPTPQLTHDEYGQVLRADGTWESQWVEVDGEWEWRQPTFGDPDYVWTTPPDTAADTIVAVIDERAGVVKEERPTGDARMRWDKQARSLALGHLAHDTSVRQLIGKRRHR